MKKLTIFSLIVALMTSLFVNMNVASADAFSGHVHENGLRYLIKKNALSPDADPSKKVTRGEFASYLSKVLNLTGGEDIRFTDVPDTYAFAVDIQRAAAVGIITGYDDGSFKPVNAITREHMAVMIDRTLDYLKYPKGTSSEKFKDNDAIGPDKRQAVAIAAKLGIIKGDNGYFKPKNNATIGQSATFIQRLMLLTGDKDADFSTYYVKEISNGALVGNASYSSFEAAEKAITKNTQVIVLNDKIIKMASGYVVTNKYVALYSEKVKDQIGVAGNTEMEYLSSDEKQVKVRLAGQVGYLKHADVILIPFSLSKGRAYYENINGEIRHTIYNHETKGSVPYTYGKAPAFMKPGEKYYSWNGINFSNASGSSKGEAYNYYQFLPARAKTQYTAEEIDQYIMQILTDREKSGATAYKEATTKSKLIGLGKILKEVEAKHQVNAMLILALGQHESNFGMSKHAQDYNNIFGLYVYDTDPLNESFDSIEANVNELMNAFWQKNYIPPTGRYAHGAVFGSKAFGFNVKYASDPFWGAKAAGHYYRADKAMGFKDAKTPYTIGLTTTTPLNVRTIPTTSGNKPLFTYPRSGMPIIITSSQTPGWYEILSDQLHDSPVYVSKDYVNVIPTVK
ncbi:MAG: S-layer homology domain-containing protein [Lysinibacillus sp.]